MFSICRQLIEEGRLAVELDQLKKAEKRFTPEIGVLERRFYQCIQQPHLIWANTRWFSEQSHNAAAAEIMKVRTDDRIASAYFRPGLYYEIFAREIEKASISRNHEDESSFIVISHGIVADDHHERWKERLMKRARQHSNREEIIRCKTFYNDYCTREFVGFLECADEETYASFRKTPDRTIEELLYVGEQHSELAAYIQYECRPLNLKSV